MKSTPENKVKQKLKEYLDGIGCFYYSATAGPYSTAGIPDIVGCHNGRFFAIEVKAPGRRHETNRGASQLQVKAILRIKGNGGFAMIFDGDYDDWEVLQEVLR